MVPDISVDSVDFNDRNENKRHRASRKGTLLGSEKHMTHIPNNNPGKTDI